MNAGRVLATILVAVSISACGAGGEGMFDLECLFCGEIKVKQTPPDPCSAKPSPVVFNPVADAELSQAFTSNTVTIAGLGAGCREAIRLNTSNLERDSGLRSFSVNGGPFQLADTSVTNGDRLRLRMVSPDSYDAENYWSPLGNGNFRVRTRPGRAADAPVVEITEPVDNAVLGNREVIVHGIANDPDGIAGIAIHTQAGTVIEPESNDGYATWRAAITLIPGLNEIYVSSADILNNKNPRAAAVSIELRIAGLQSPAVMETDTANHRLLVVDRQSLSLVAVDLASGESTVISDDRSPGEALEFVDPHKLVVNSTGSTAWLADRGYDPVITIDLETGARTRLVDSVDTQSGISIQGAEDLILDELNDRLLVLTGRLESAQIVSVDLSTGERRILSAATMPNGGAAFGVPKSMALDSVGNSLFVFQQNVIDLEPGGDAVLLVDPGTGHRQVVLDNSVFIDTPIDTIVDTDNNRVIILARDDGPDSLGADVDVLAFDLIERELSSMFFCCFRGEQIAPDSWGGRLLLLSRHEHWIYAIDPETGLLVDPF